MITAITTVILGLLWSWLLFVDVAQLSKGSIVTGHGVSVISFLVIVALSVFVFTRVIGYLIREYKKHKKLPARFILMILSVWAAAELFVSWFITVIWIGSGGSVDTVLPFGSFTPLLMFTPLSFLARFVGFHGLSAVFVLVIFVLAARKARRFALPVIGAVLLGTVGAWVLYRSPNGQLIRVHIMAEELGEKESVIETDADLVVFPEYGLDEVHDGSLHDRVRASGQSEVFFVGSKQRSVESGEIENVLSFGSTTQGFREEFAKKRLIPAGEYLPFAVEMPLQTLGASDVIQTFSFSRKVKKGSEAARPFVAREGFVIGAEACASIITPNDYRVLTRQGATVLANAASLEIFKSKVFDIQHEGLGRFMAVANARPMLQSSNAAQAFAVDHNGRMLQSLRPVASAEVQLMTNSKQTPYTYLGEWVAYMGFVYFLVKGLRILWAKRHARPRTQAK